ncbi:hypothetical protein G6F37_003826 [Rhizopus arrhizus]|nr:hypothetical protein G6F38_002846 [Rhizopus arrhizus]KAG1160626.1 hypothetical protein G6F37_003826 [Rhizopus arrhizus]
MDYDDSFFSAPVRYAVDELESDEELQADAQEKTIHTDLTCSSVDTNLTLIFGPAGPGNVYIDSLDKKPTKIGTVTCTAQDKQETKANILQMSGQPIIFISFSKVIDAEDTVQYTRSILNQFKNKISKIIVLDSFASENDLTPPTIRVLQSSSSPVIKGLTLYEIPHMITGLPAAIVNYCEIHSIPCFDLLTLQEYVYGKLLVTEDTLIAYNQGLSQLDLNLQFDSQLLQQVLNHHGRINDNHHRLYI